MPSRQKPDETVARSSKKFASRFYLLNTGHYLTGRCLNWTKSHPTAQCWWCSRRTRTRNLLFKVCPRGGPTSGTVEGPTEDPVGRGRRASSRSGTSSPMGGAATVLGFLCTTDVGSLVPAEEDAGCEASERELRKQREREEDWRQDGFFFVYSYSHTAFLGLWRRTFCTGFPSAVCATAASCEFPFALRPNRSQKDRIRTTGISKEKNPRQRDNKMMTKGSVARPYSSSAGAMKEDVGRNSGFSPAPKFPGAPSSFSSTSRSSSRSRSSHSDTSLPTSSSAGTSLPYP